MRLGTYNPEEQQEIPTGCPRRRCMIAGIRPDRAPQPQSDRKGKTLGKPNYQFEKRQKDLAKKKKKEEKLQRKTAKKSAEGQEQPPAEGSNVS